MLKSFLTIAFRNIQKHRGFSLINIAGLTLGLTAVILIGLFVWDEYQFDRNIRDRQQVYRVWTEYKNNDGTQNMALTPPVFATTLLKDFPEVEKTARVLSQPEYKKLFEAGNNKMYEESGFIADSTFFDIFPLEFKYGSAEKILDAPSSIVLSDGFAERLFGNENPVGKGLLMDKSPFLVTAVVKKDPKFHLPFNYVIPISATARDIPASRMESWGWHQFLTYLKLKPGIKIPVLESKFQKEVTRLSKLSNPDASNSDKPFFQALGDVHLYSSNFKFDMAKRGNIVYVKALTIIAVFILLIACFNFVNLATAKSLQRAKEVGVRKSIGAGKNQLIIQFIGETMVLAFISILVSVALAALVLPWLNAFTGKNVPVAIFVNPFMISLLFMLGITVGILAGFYPAIVLSGFKPVNVLKGSQGWSQPGRIPWLRHGLVVLQFTLSALLIISAMVVFKQVSYLHNKDLGFNKDQIMFFPMRGDKMNYNTEAFKNELVNVPGVSSVSIGYGFPGDAVAGDEIITVRNGQPVSLSATQLTVDFDYIKTLGLQLITGRDFSRSMGTDKDHAWIINETAVNQLGFGTPQKALGQTLSWHPWGAANPDSLKTGQIIGVVKDFNYKSLYDKVETTVIQIFPAAAWKVAVKMNTTDAANTIHAINGVWSKYSPEYPLEYKFLDENFEQMYNAEDKLKSLLWIFTSMAIFVGCLGLLGLAAYAAERRKKEIGIRKVLGASVNGIVILLSKDFIKLVFLALLLASPLAWYFMNKWLQDFAYRIHLSGWILTTAALTVLGIALITVSFQAIRAALANPVKSLRTE